MTTIDVDTESTELGSSTGLLTEIWEWVSENWIETILISIATAIFSTVFAAILALAFSPAGIVVLATTCVISLVLKWHNPRQ